jgi:hypothetical protein
VCGKLEREAKPCHTAADDDEIDLVHWRGLFLIGKIERCAKTTLSE